MFTFDTCNAVISYVTAGALNVTSYSLILNCFSQQINALQTKRDISERVDKRPVMRDDICLTSCHALSSCPILLPLHCTATPPNLGFRGALWALQMGSVRSEADRTQPKLNLGHFDSEIWHLLWSLSSYDDDSAIFATKYWLNSATEW